MTNSNNTIVGGSGFGKTYFCKNWVIPQYVNAGIPVPIIDVKGYDFRDVSQIQVEPEKFPEAYKQGHMVMRWNPPHAPSKTDELGKIVDRFYKGASRLLKVAGYVHTIHDEVHEVSRPSHIYSNKLSKFWKKGRGYGASGSAVTQESTDLKKSIVNNSMDIFVFNADELHDKILSKLSVSQRDIENLGVGEFYHYNKMSKETTKHHPI